MRDAGKCWEVLRDVNYNIAQMLYCSSPHITSFKKWWAFLQRALLHSEESYKALHQRPLLHWAFSFLLFYGKGPSWGPLDAHIFNFKITCPTYNEKSQALHKCPYYSTKRASRGHQEGNKYLDILTNPRMGSLKSLSSLSSHRSLRSLRSLRSH